MRQSIVAAAALVACFSAPLAPAGVAAEPSTARAADVGRVAPSARVIVRFKADSPLVRARIQSHSATLQHASRAVALGQRIGLGLRSGAGLAERTQVVHAEGLRSDELAALLRAQPDVEFAVPDQRRRWQAAPNDPRYISGPPAEGPAVGQWYLRAPTSTTPSAINAEAAWSITTGDPNVVVAVLDTGVRFDHSDLPLVAAGGALLPGYDMISDVAVANDGDGRDGDASDPGDWVTAEESSQSGGPFEKCGKSDSSWHGTHMAGLIAAATNNGVGMASVGRRIRVLPVRVLGKCGGFDSDIIAGARWAAGLSVPDVPANPHPARVLNLSLGSEGTCTDAYRSAIAEITAAGVTIVASAGNSAGHAVSTPANCPGVIAVGGLRHAGTKVGFSDLGPEIAVSAPGGNCVDTAPGAECRYPILTTTNEGRRAPVPGSSTYTDAFNISVGTSYAAPMVTGTAGLMLSIQPALTPDELRQRIQQTARRFPTTGADNGSEPAPVGQCTAPQFDASGRAVDQLQCYCTATTCGAGMLDAPGAVRAAALPTARVTVTPEVAVVGEVVTLTAAASTATAGRTIVGIRWSIADGGGIVAGFTSPPQGATTSLTPIAPGRFSVSLSVTDSSGATATTTYAIDVVAKSTPASAAASASAAGSSGGGGGGGGGALDWEWLAALLAAIAVLRWQQAKADARLQQR